VTPDEKSIWVAAYAAAYVSDFTEMRKLAEAVGPRDRDPSAYFPFDEAEQRTSAEYALFVANIAVDKLRKWVASEGSKGVPVALTLEVSEVSP
jgi:hypothetical protein